MAARDPGEEGACLGLLAAGAEDLPLAALQRERERLTSQRHQAELARSLGRLITRVSVSDFTPTARPPSDPRVLNEATPELAVLQRQLEAGELSMRATALVEQLISSPMSPLYGRDADELTRVIGRMRYLA